MNTKKIIDAIQNSKDFILKNALNRFTKIIDINDLKNNETDKQNIDSSPIWLMISENENKTTFRIEETDKNINAIDIIDKYKNKPLSVLSNVKIHYGNIIYTPLFSTMYVYHEAGIEFIDFAMCILVIDNGNKPVLYRLYNLREENNKFLVDCVHTNVSTDCKLLSLKIYEKSNNNWFLEVLNGVIADIETADIISVKIEQMGVNSYYMITSKHYENKENNRANFTLATKNIEMTSDGLYEQTIFIQTGISEGVIKTSNKCGISRPY